jgi:hypothetical protein
MENGVILIHQTAVSQPKYVESSDRVERGLENRFLLGPFIGGVHPIPVVNKTP